MLKVNNKRIINKVSAKCLYNNKMRNIFIMIAVILTTALIGGVFTCGVSFYKTYDFYQRMGQGVDSDGYIVGNFQEYNEIKQNKKIDKAGILCDAACDKLQLDKAVGKNIYLKYADESLYEMNFVKPIEGTFPMNADDILIPIYLLDIYNMPHEINQNITINVPLNRGSVNGIRAITFNVCGYYKSIIPPVSNYGEVYTSNKFISEYKPKLKENSNNIYIKTKSLNRFSSYLEADKFFSQINEEVGGYGYGISTDYAITSFSDIEDIIKISLMVIIIALLISACGYFLIYNIVSISVVNDIQFYGLLKTIGTTKKQIRRIILKQVIYLSIISIPIGLFIGYIIGRVFTPMIISLTNFKDFIKLSNSPFVFIIAGLFSFFTVLISCRKPMKTASLVSPVEAVKYTGYIYNDKSKQYRKTKKNSIIRIGFINITRNRKKTSITVISISLAAIIFTIVSNVTIGYDECKIADRYNQGDITLKHETLKYNIDNPYQPFDYKIYEKIKELDIVDNVDIYYMGRSDLDVNVISENYKYYFSNSEIQDNGLLKKEIDSIYEASSIYDYDDMKNKRGNLSLAVLSVPYYKLEEEVTNCSILNGKIDMEKFKTGDYIIYQSPNDFYEGYNLGGDIIRSGDKLNLSFYDYAIDEYVEKEFTVMAVIEVKDIFNKYHIRKGHTIIMPNKSIKEIYSNYKEQIAALEIYTKELLTKNDVDRIKNMISSTANFQINIESKYDWYHHFLQEKHSISIIGYSLSFIIGLIGLLNMINTLITSIYNRKKEIACLQSIGMTRKQLKIMIMTEGESLCILSLLIIAPISIILLRLISDNVMFPQFNLLIYLISLIGICLILSIVSIIITHIMLRVITKRSMIDRIN